MKQFCPNCGALQVVRVETREETYTFRGEDITTSHEFYVCSVCSEEFSTAAQAEESLRAVREEYRRGHDLVTPEEIVRIRKQYNVGQKPFGTILGLGEATINSYERGDIPTVAHSSLIRQAGDRQVFERLYRERRALVGPTQQKRIDAALAERPALVIGVSRGIEAHEEPDEYTGFRPQSKKRLEALFSAILTRVSGPVYKTRLLKLAFLADQHHFRAHTVSLTGWPYARLDHGPVPQDYKEMLVAAEEDGFVASEDHDDGTTTFTPGDEAAATRGESLFSEDELSSIDEVIRRWGTLSAAELSQFTHTLSAWQKTSHAREISYAWTLEEAWPE